MHSVSFIQTIVKYGCAKSQRIMKACFCNCLYRKSKPIKTTEHAFSGSLCRISEYETDDGMRYCLKTFSPTGREHLNFPSPEYGVYNDLHFPHDEYKYIIRRLYALLSMRAISPTQIETDAQKININLLSVKQLPLSDAFEIKFGKDCLAIGPVSAIGLVNTSPFADIDVFSVIKNDFKCDPEWEICICKTCPAFKRLTEIESAVVKRIGCKKLVDVIFF